MSREFAEKLEKLRGLLVKKRKLGALITRQPNFSWLACGGEARVALNTDKASGYWLVTKNKAYLLANTIEMPRLKSEALAQLRFEPVEFPWFEPTGLEKTIKKIVDPKRVLSDSRDIVAQPQPEVFAVLRYSLSREEVERFQHLGKALEAAMSAAANTVRVEETEHDIAAQMSAAALAVGVQPVVLLVAVDERIRRFRHPLPTGRKLKRHAMLIMCGRHQGLIASMTRTVYFGDLPAGLARKHKAVCTVDVAMQQSTRVGAQVRNILQVGVQEYGRMRYPNEWQSHHQGGPCGYLPREYAVNPKHAGVVQPYQPFTWNPTISGAKSEDTILATPEGIELITKSQNWPMVEIVWEGRKYTRYGILER
ncbi:MAG: hypothetical protein M2R45_05291 [Verrucomicrobia subdivision 3 bacterium]|nr:hypothetical protein [Limisphaerales bacterium]MCS1417830.1 hypothetical protein [Limisphaerales bacterium]